MKTLLHRGMSCVPPLTSAVVGDKAEGKAGAATNGVKPR